jgi:hypothetical protein
MADFGVFDKAKQVREQAAARAQEMREQAASKAAGMKDAVTTRASDMKDSVVTRAADVKESVSTAASEATDSMKKAALEAKDASIEKMRQAIDDFNASLPLIREAGYHVGEVAIGIGLPPKIVATFSAAPDITEEHVNEVIEAHSDKRLTVLIVRSLLAAWKVQNKINIVGMKPRGMAVELGIVPSVTIKFA